MEGLWHKTVGRVGKMCCIKIITYVASLWSENEISITRLGETDRTLRQTNNIGLYGFPDRDRALRHQYTPKIFGNARKLDQINGIELAEDPPRMLAADQGARPQSEGLPQKRRQ